MIKGKITIFVAMSIGIYEKTETKQEFSNNCQPKSRDLKMKIKSRDKISFKLQIFLLKTKYYYLMRQRRFAKHYPY